MNLAPWRHRAPRHRAADRVRQLTAERDYLLAALTKQDGQVKAAHAQTQLLLARVDRLTRERDELFARYQELTTISVPAPADLDDTMPIPMPKVIPLSVAFAPNKAAA